MIRYRKVLRDLTSNGARTTMLIAAIAIGLLALGVILGAYTVIKREMKANYMATVPASATLESERAAADEPSARQQRDGEEQLATAGPGRTLTKPGRCRRPRRRRPSGR